MNTLNRWTRTASAVLASMLLSAEAFAQTSQSTGGTVTTTTTTTVWYGQWWVWAVGVAVFLIVVIALTNRGGKTST